MWKRDIARRLLANSTQPYARSRDEVNNCLIFLAKRKNRRRYEAVRAMIFDVEFLLATQQIAAITGLPIKHARERLARATEVILGHFYSNQVQCSASNMNGYDMAQMFHVIVRECIGLSSKSNVSRLTDLLST